MNERLLQYIWQFQYFNRNALCTEQGERLQIIQAGRHNTNQGPDFLDAKIRLGTTTWAGSIELHIKSSDWHRHKHSDDSNYQNIILHVVWEHDDDSAPLQLLPTLVLQHRVSTLLLQQYAGWMQQPFIVPCAHHLTRVSDIVWLSWKERLMMERLQQKTGYIYELLQQCNMHWEEVLWWMLARNFGGPVNAMAFECIARSIPMELLARHKPHVLHLEALLLGQAGLLTGDFKEFYPQTLQKEYAFLQHKYQLVKPAMPVQFLRMRPAAFPTVRLAQLAMLIHQSTHLFSQLMAAEDVSQVKYLLQVTAHEYWHQHYVFNEMTAAQPKKTGSTIINHIIINTVVPMLFTYGAYHQQAQYKERVLKWLLQLTAEKNKITKSWQQLGIASEHAFDSQALITLKNNYCNVKRCLDCAIGNALLKKTI